MMYATKNNTAEATVSDAAATAHGKAVRLLRRAILLSLVAAAPILVVCSDICSRAASDALQLCAETVIPSLFPYLVLASLISSSGAAELIGNIAHRPFSVLFGIDGALCSAFLIGTLSGYPAGAAATVQLYRSGACKREDAERALAFCNNTGPAFLIGGIGAGVLGSPALGALIYISQLCAAVCCGVLLRPHGKRKKPRTQIAPAERLGAARQFVSAVSGAGSTMLVICSFIVFFAVVAALLRHVLEFVCIENAAFHALFLSLFELTAGVTVAAEAGSAAALICSAAVGWSGLSVLFQTMSVLEGSGLSARYYVTGKAMQAVLCPLFTLIIMMLTGSTF